MVRKVDEREIAELKQTIVALKADLARCEQLAAKCEEALAAGKRQDKLRT